MLQIVIGRPCWLAVLSGTGHHSASLAHVHHLCKPEKAAHGAPVGDQDDQILEVLAVQATRNLPIFGENATTDWPLSDCAPWLAVRTSDGSRRVFTPGFVGRLIACDLSFGCVLRAPEHAVRRAKEAGNVKNPEAVFIINCRGRKGLLGEDSLAEELDHIRSHTAGGTVVFGMYSDGETSPSPGGLNQHWNWCSSAFVIGGDFNPDYAVAAKAEYSRTN